MTIDLQTEYRENAGARYAAAQEEQGEDHTYPGIHAPDHASRRETSDCVGRGEKVLAGTALVCYKVHCLAQLIAEFNFILK